MINKIFLFLFCAGLAGAHGHQFWMQPDKFMYDRTEPVNIRFFSGDDFTGDNWTGDKSQVASMKLYFGNVVDTSVCDNLEDDEGDSLQLAMIDEGTVMVSLQSKKQYYTTDPQSFSQYLKDYGATTEVVPPATGLDSLQAIQESCILCAKTILQVGEVFSDSYTKRSNTTIELVPADNPYDPGRDSDDFRIKVFFKGEKLSNANIQVWHKTGDSTSRNDYVTDANGELKFSLVATGEWMISCLKLVRVPNEAHADWLTYCGTLTWGYY